MRRRSPWLATEGASSGDASKPSRGLGLLRSRVLAINSPMIASGRPRKNSATKAPRTMSSTEPPDFAFLSTARQSAPCRVKNQRKRGVERGVQKADTGDADVFCAPEHVESRHTSKPVTAAWVRMRPDWRPARGVWHQPPAVPPRLPEPDRPPNKGANESA
jgi:hypothetical protein